MRYIIFSFIVFSLQACTDQGQKSPETVALQIKSPDSAPVVKENVESDKFELNESVQSYLKFSGSVEAEIFKIIDPAFKKTSKIPSQLLILSQLIELKLSKKTKIKNSDIFYNCSQIRIENSSNSEILISPTCEKNSQIMARIKKNGIQQYEVRFIQSEWKNVVGASAILNQKDKVCQISISDKKVNKIICENTLITAGAGIQLEEIKLKKITFNRVGQKQIVVDGGRFKDYLERSHIHIVVPETGKINFKEEEISIKDDFEPVSHTEVQGEVNSGEAVIPNPNDLPAEQIKPPDKPPGR